MIHETEYKNESTESGDGDGFKEKAQGFPIKKIINKLMVFEVGSDLR